MCNHFKAATATSGPKSLNLFVSPAFNETILAKFVHHIIQDENNCLQQDENNKKY